MKPPRRLYWRLCIGAVVLLSALTFTPLVTPAGRYEPMVAGMPLTLWAGLLIAFLLVLLTYVGTRIFPGSEREAQENP